MEKRGFEWPMLFENHDIPVADHGRRGTGGWRVIREESPFPEMMRTLNPDSRCFYYADHAHHMDMKFIYDAVDRPNVMVTFVLGYPVFEMENDVEYMTRNKA